jgi:acetoin utilization deacetylase AcuC-like enzyme
MLILHDPRCADYGSSMRPEQPARVTKTAAHLRAAHPDWEWREPGAPAGDEILRLAHTAEHLKRLDVPRDFDDDTPFFPGIAEQARRAVTAAIEAAMHALETKTPAFALMRPPGHHATATQAMGFCYLNNIALAALHAQRSGGERGRRVAIWDFDAHHGNGTEAIVHGQSDIFFASVHQYPGYPGTGTQDHGPRVRNWPVLPRTPRVDHMAALRASFDAVRSFAPDLILVSAGFDAYARDPITHLTLEREDFATLGSWLRAAGHPAAAILEGGYSEDLPLLVDAFLSAWDKPASSAA